MDYKFKAWIENPKKMIGPFGIFEIRQGEPHFPITEFLLFTGLKDKNDKEIYEGDILENPNYDKDDWERCVVNWHDEFARFGLNFYSPMGGEGYTGREQHIDVFVLKHGCYVIGNVYEDDIYDKNLAKR